MGGPEPKVNVSSNTLSRPESGTDVRGCVHMLGVGGGHARLHDPKGLYEHGSGGLDRADMNL
jgi:hypothetical protein